MKNYLVSHLDCSFQIQFETELGYYAHSENNIFSTSINRQEHPLLADGAVNEKVSSHFLAGSLATVRNVQVDDIMRFFDVTSSGLKI